MTLTLSSPTGPVLATLIFANDRFIAARVGEDKYFRFRRKDGKPAGSMTQMVNPYWIEASELRRLA